MPKMSAGLTRRAMLGAVAAASLFSEGVRAAAAATTGIDLTSAEGRLDAFMMMRGALDDRLVIGFVTGR